MSTTLPFSASPLPPSMLNAAYHHVEGNGNPFLAASSLSSSKSKWPVPAGEKPPTVVEMAKTQDYPDPLPIPEGKHGTLPSAARKDGETRMTQHIQALSRI